MSEQIDRLARSILIRSGGEPEDWTDDPRRREAARAMARAMLDVPDPEPGSDARAA